MITTADIFEPRQLGIKADMGVGKTEQVIRMGLDVLRENPDARLAVFVPGHAQTVDLERRWNRAAGVRVAAIWRGTEQPDPDAPGEKMCRCSGALSEVKAASGRIEDLCGSRKRGFCPFNPEANGPEVCGYQRQSRGDAESVRVWILPHSMLDKSPPAVLRASGGFAAVIIDESPFLKMVRDAKLTLPLAVLATEFSGRWAVPAIDGEQEEMGSKRLTDICDRIRMALGGEKTGRLRCQPLSGVSANDCYEAEGLAWRLKAPPSGSIEPGCSATRAREVLISFKQRNSTVKQMTRFFRQLAKTIEANGDFSPYIELRAAKDTGGAAAGMHAVMSWKKPIDNYWLSFRVIYIDGTLQVELARYWLPRLELVEAPSVCTPRGVYRRQVADNVVSKGKVVPNPHASYKDQTTQSNNVETIRRMIEVRAHEFRGCGEGGTDGLIIVPKDLEAELRKGRLPPNVAIGHHNGLRGVDKYRGVAYLAIVSRPLPSPADVERIAWAISGKVGQSCGDQWYSERGVRRLMADGTGESTLAIYHPDPVAEAVRWGICEGELLQLEARARAVRRGECKPLLVEIVTNVPLPLPINETITWADWKAEAGPVRLMIARGIIPSDWKGTVQLLSDFFRTVRTKDAPRVWFAEHPKERREREMLLNNEGTPIKKNTYRRSFAIRAPLWQLWSYRRAGERKGSTVLIREDVADPRMLAEGYFGKLDRWNLNRPARKPVASAEPEDRLSPSAWLWPKRSDIHFVSAHEFAVIGKLLTPWMGSRVSSRCRFPLLRPERSDHVLQAGISNVTPPATNVS